MQKYALSIAALSALFAGCATQSSGLKHDKARLKSTLSDVRVQNRSQRARIRDLENQVFLLRDKLETAEVRGARVGDAAPKLPVQVRGPDRAKVAANDGYKVMGVDSQGNEIVYVGDAAKDDSTRPQLHNYNTPAPHAGPPPGERKRRTRSRIRVGHVPTTTDRIPTTGRGRLPTVQNQLRRVQPTRAPAAEPRPAPTFDGPKQEYQTYYGALRAGRHADAIRGFRKFVRRYPNHDYADNAQYWLGESYYHQKQFRRAQVEFRKVVTAYPKGNKLPDALLKLGFCYLSLGENNKAGAVLRQVATIYPRTRAAKLASARLAQLKMLKKKQE